MKGESYFPFFNEFPMASVIYKILDDGEDFVFVDLNKACESSEKIHRDQVINKRLTEAFPGVKETGFLEAMFKAFHTGKSVHTPLHLYKDNRIQGYRECWIFKVDEQHVFVFYYNQDERVNLSKDLETQKKKSEEISHLALLGESSALISHEIKNPLSVIQSAVSLIRRALNKGDFNREDILLKIDKIEKSSHRISKIVAAVLSLIKQQGQYEEVQKVSVESLLNEVNTIFTEQCMEHDIQLYTKSNIYEDIEISCVPIQIIQVLSNFISNSIDSIRKSRLDKWILVQAEKVGNMINFSVLDSGEPLSQDVIEKIGNKYFSTKAVNGHGLGLYVSKKIADYHNAKISASNLNGHPCFNIQIPDTLNITFNN